MGQALKGIGRSGGICKKTNKGGRSGDIKAAMCDTDVYIALSTLGPGIIKREWGVDVVAIFFRRL
ncbi:hypothetical protein C5S53_10370 [Methanophagales archaeon]|jgi:hypothetical protein|nr:hypothetical protein C5S53_10370 [Methanophagales archaeon]